jgi:hypothetical protein
MEVRMATPLDPEQTVSLEELLISQMVQQEALTRLLVEKGIFTKEEFLEPVRAVDRERKRKRGTGARGHRSAFRTSYKRGRR